MYSKVQTANKIIRMIYQFLLIVLSINVCLVLIYFPTLTAWEMIFIAVMLMVSYFFRDKFSRAFMLLLVHMVLTVILVFTLPNMAPKSPADLTLHAGEIVTVEPGIYVEGLYGCRIEDMVHITPGGAVNLTKAPKELIEL